MVRLTVYGLLLIAYVNLIDAKCPLEATVALPFVLEYALWRGWQQAVIYPTATEPGCSWATLSLVKCLSVNGVASAINSTKSKPRSRVGVVMMSPRLKRNATKSLENLIKEMQKLQMGSTYYDWLIATRSDQDFRLINKILNDTSIRFDQNMVIAYPTYKTRIEKPMRGLCENNFSYKINRQSNLHIKSHKLICDVKYNRKSCYRRKMIDGLLNNEYRDGYYRSTLRFKNLARNYTYKKFGKMLPLLTTGMTNFNYSRSFEMTNVSRFSLTRHFRRWTQANAGDGLVQIQLVQYFKVRVNSTLYAHYLGVWTQETSMSHVEEPYPVEARDFLGEEMVVGRCNSTGDGAPVADDEGPTPPATMEDVLHFISVRLNTKSSMRLYSKLGFRTYEGTWTGLLGALMDESVDVALEPVTAHTARNQDMDFIFPIAETMCNIYIRQQETSTVRDIFLAPFSGRLMACVVAVAVAAAAAIVLVSRLASPPSGDRRMGCAEAMIWATGILCQQGGTWTPPSPAASVLLIVCLFFAVVTYNAYAAFITSVLSVRVASVDTVAAVLRSPDFKIGYIKNGADQMYLMSTKDVQLNAFYIRGYSDAENLVSSAEEGLARAARQDYAFFAGQRVARLTLRSLSQARGRCAVREVPVHSTRAQLAFPLPRHSPYARVMLLSLLQLRSGGSLARLEAALVPDMPYCDPPAGFASARATDVRSALILLLVGYVTALLIGIAEFSWKNRKEIQAFLSRMCGYFINILK